MSCDHRLCPGVGGRRCGAFMSPIFRDPHPTCARCRDVRCMADVACVICRDWSVAQWEAFLKKRPYSSCRKQRPSGSALSPVPQTTPPSASSSSEAGHPPPLLLRGLVARGGGGGGGVPREAPPPSSLSLEEAPRVPWLLGARGIRLPLPSRGGGVAGSSLSQKSLVIADPVPVASSALLPVAVGHGREGGGRLPATAPARAPLAYPPLGVGILERSIAVPTLGPGVTVACRVGRSPAPRTVHGLVDGAALAVTRPALAVTRPALLLPVCGLVAPGRSLRTATGIAECARALGVTVRGLNECARDLLAGRA